MRIKLSKGFTLIEMAVVMLILAFLLTSVFMPFSAQRESADIRKAREELLAIEEALYGFAIAQGRIPCPATASSNGIEATTGNPPPPGVDCSVVMGFVPASTLGMKGNFNCDGLLLDPWGNPYRYAVTNIDTGAAGQDFVTNGEMVAIGAGALAPNLTICTDNSCATRLSTNAVAVYMSMGKNWASFNGVDEVQNSGEGTLNNTPGPDCPAKQYRVGTNITYVHHERIETGANYYDDIVMWLSPNILYKKMLDAGHRL